MISYEGCSEIIETPAVNKLIEKLQILFLVLRKHSISADGIQVFERLGQIFQSQDKPERRKPLVPGALQRRKRKVMPMTHIWALDLKMYDRCTKRGSYDLFFLNWNKI